MKTRSNLKPWLPSCISVTQQATYWLWGSGVVFSKSVENFTATWPLVPTMQHPKASHRHQRRTTGALNRPVPQPWSKKIATHNGMDKEMVGMEKGAGKGAGGGGPPCCDRSRNISNRVVTSPPSHACCVANPPSKLCKPHSLCDRVAMDSPPHHQQQQQRQEMPSEETPARAASAVPCCREATGSPTFSQPKAQIWNATLEGEQRRRWPPVGGGCLTSILRPSTRVPWSFSLALSASALDSNVTKPKPCRREHKRKMEKEYPGKQKKWWQKKRYRSVFFPPPLSYLGASLVKNDLHVKDFAKLLQWQERWEK